MPEHIPTSQILAHGAIAVFGAVTHALSAHRKGESKSFADFISLTLMSSFSGVMFSLVALHYVGGDQYLTLAFAGTGGFLGVEGMGWLVEKVKKMIAK